MPKILCLMGGSGSGKTVLAKKLQEFNPKKYERVVEITTRPKREEEVEGVDYFFVDDQKYDKMLPTMIETVEYQFLPYRYGANLGKTKKDKWYILVVSIEGFLSLLNRWDEIYIPDDDCVLVNILIDTDMDIQRPERNAKSEENINLAILENIDQVNFKMDYTRVDLPLSELKKFRNDKEKCLEYFDEICS